MQFRSIPKSGEQLPVIGLGTWQTFDVRNAKPLVAVLDRFVDAGGRLIDTSPMYGRAEEVAGEIRGDRELFIATKVWTRAREAGIAQMQRSMKLLRATQIDLMQIHNLVDWRVHLETLRRWKDEGRIRYIGITHYHAGAFADLESIMRSEDIDFVQLPMSAALPDAEERLLPLAQDRGIAVIVNRPFEGGSLVSDPELLLRYVVSHPAVTCAIPATSNPEHLIENMRAGDAPPLSTRERVELRKRLLSGRQAGS